jgi:hypothetical protein
MKTIKTHDLLEQLKSDTRQIILETKLLLQQDPELLVQQPAPGKWSVAQAIEHLNAYGRYYIPEIRKALGHHKYSPDELYRPGWLGNYFTNAMKPTPDKQIRNKMKALKNYSPAPELDSKAVIDEFLNHQQELLNLLDQASSNNISRIRIPISITKFIRFKLGDTFRFVIAHEQRHFVQCSNVLFSLKTPQATAV